MTPEQVGLIQDSWRRVQPVADTAGEVFYSRLFKVQPQLQELFAANLEEQGRKLMAMINTAVASLDRLDELVPALREMGRRHAGYGVGAEDYDTVGDTLLWTLARALGGDFTPALREAWGEAYAVLAATMKDGAVGAA
jgi:hemoglobin-like flavoprotein